MNKKERELIRDMKRRWAIKCRQGELVCFLCGQKITSMKQCNAEHWIPRALGGKTTEENLKAAHILCNSRKGCIPPDEFELHRDEILSGKYLKTNKDSSRKESFTQKQTKKQNVVGLGDMIYYIQAATPELNVEIEIKRGIVIGHTKNDQVFVRDYYLTDQGIIKSKLITVIPLSKKQIMQLKAELDIKRITKILEQQAQNTR